MLMLQFLTPEVIPGGVLRETGGDDQREVREDDEIQAESSHAGANFRHEPISSSHYKKNEST